MLLNRVLLHVAPEPLIEPCMERTQPINAAASLWGLSLLQLAAGCWRAAFRTALSPRVGSPGGREAPRCSRGEIYASGSCRNADSVQRVEREKKNPCSASALDKLTRSKPHGCHNLDRGERCCMLKKKTKKQ